MLEVCLALFGIGLIFFTESRHGAQVQFCSADFSSGGEH